MLHEDELNCKEIAHEIVKEVLAEYNVLHLATCPTRRLIVKWVCVSIGIAIGSGTISGGLLLAALRAVGGI